MRSQKGKYRDKTELEIEFKELEKMNKSDRIQHNRDFDRLKKESRNHREKVNDRLNRFIHSRNK